MKRPRDNEKLNPEVVVNGNGPEAKLGPPMGVVDIGVSNMAYLCRVSLPRLRKKKFVVIACEMEKYFNLIHYKVYKWQDDLSFEIKRDGTVIVRGAVKVHELLKDSPAGFQTIVQELNPPGPFTISFSLPGPVDTRVILPQFRGDGILEIVVYKAGCCPSV